LLPFPVKQFVVCAHHVHFRSDQQIGYFASFFQFVFGEIKKPHQCGLVPKQRRLSNNTQRSHRRRGMNLEICHALPRLSMALEGQVRQFMQQRGQDEAVGVEATMASYRVSYLHIDSPVLICVSSEETLADDPPACRGATLNRLGVTQLYIYIQTEQKVLLFQQLVKPYVSQMENYSR
jgi:hypothetical protein